MSDDSPVQYMQAINERYAGLGCRPNQWYAAASPPAFQSLARPVSESRLGVLGTAGTYVAGQVAYFYKDDTSTREIPKDTPAARLRIAHITENYLEDARRDPNCIFPIEALRGAEADGQIAELAPELLSCRGALPLGYCQWSDLPEPCRERPIPVQGIAWCETAARGFENQQVEALVKRRVLHRMRSLGLPVSGRVLQG